MSARILIPLTAILLCLAPAADGATIYVPDDWPGIKSAIQAASNGDTIIVRPGTYHELVDFIGKALTLRSEQGPEVTIIDGGDVSSVVVFQNAEGPDSIIDGFTLTNGSGYFRRGGGIHCKSASPSIRNCVITENKTDHMMDSGGGIYLYGSEAVIENCIISDNAANYGGGLYADDSSLELIGCVFSGNVGRLSGGAIGIDRAESLTLQDCLITGNTIEYQGGGINVDDTQAVLIKDCRITDNTSGGSGGGLHIDAEEATLERCTVSGNASGWSGGGLLVHSTELKLSHSIVSANSAVQNGGGLYLSRSDLPCLLVNSIFNGNTAEIDGGGAYLVTAVDCINCTFHDNEATFFGGGIYCAEYSAARVVNSIFWNDRALGWPEIHPRAISTTVTHSNVKGGYSGAGNIDADPLFLDAAGGDLHLTLGSPCFNGGDAAALPPDVATDFEGDPRAWLGPPDMGADELATHVYTTDAVSPGSVIDIRIIGLLAQAPVTIIVDNNVQDPPRPTRYGDAHVVQPYLAMFHLGFTGNDGVLVHAATVPAGWTAVSRYYAQALVGYEDGPYAQLSNLFVIEVE